MTQFAGGLIQLPKPINFAEAFAKADFSKNSTVYLTLITTAALFLLLTIYAHHKDTRDANKVGLSPMPDNKPGDSYFYEILVFTGCRDGSATDSRVRLILSGSSQDTGVRLVYDRSRRAFRTGGVDSFIMATDKPLDHLSYLRVWHDNSGRGDMASWYCSLYDCGL